MSKSINKLKELSKITMSVRFASLQRSYASLRKKTFEYYIHR